MKSSDEIKKAKLHCSPVSCRSDGCPYGDDTPKYEGDMPVCRMKLWHDMGCLIQQLEADKKQLEGMLTHMNQLRDAAAGRALKMEERVHQLEAERDALINDIRREGGLCALCEHRGVRACEEPCRSCNVLRISNESKWQWRGVQKEE